MTPNEVTNAIIEYLREPPTAAIMIDAPWGVGKSYYVRNELQHQIQQNHPDKRPIMISLYGMTSVHNITKNLYQQRMSQSLMKIKLVQKWRQWMQNRKIRQVKETAQAAGSLICAGAASLCNIGDISTWTSDKTWHKVYETVDLRQNYVIFEDVERCSIDIVELLGYINHLTEYQHVHVILVSHEAKLRSAASNQQYNYSTMREKVIDAILRLQPTQENAVMNIIKETFAAYRYPFLSDCAQYPRIAQNTLNLLQSPINLRTFRNACRQIQQILLELTKLEISISDSQIENLYYSTVFFLNKTQYDTPPAWDDPSSHLSILLATTQHPLYRMCYEYYVNREFTSDNAIRSLKEYDILRQHHIDAEKQVRENKELRQILKLCTYYVCTEQEIQILLPKFKKAMRHNIIPLQYYGELVETVLALHKMNIITDVKQYEDLFMANVTGQCANQITPQHIFAPYAANPELIDMNEYCRLRTNMINALNEPPRTSCTSEPLTFEILLKVLQGDNPADAIAESNIDILFDIFMNINPQQFQNVRSEILGLYRQKQTITVNDIIMIRKLHTLALKLRNLTNTDVIYQLQLQWFIENLNDIANSLNETSIGRIQLQLSQEEEKRFPQKELNG